MWLAAMAGTFVGDIADVIRIETFRSTPLILDESKNTKPADGLLLLDSSRKCGVDRKV